MENYALSYIRRTEKLPRTRFFRFAMTLVISTLVATLFLVPHSVSAAQSTSTKGTAAVKAGDLTANFAGNVIGSFSDTIDLSTNKSGSITAKLNNLTVQDSTGTGRGYDVVLSATQLKEVTPTGGFKAGTTAKALPTKSLQLNVTGSELQAASNTTSVKPALQTGNKTVDGDSITILKAGKNAGQGQFDYSFSDQSLTLFYDPATTPADPVNYPSQDTPYETTVTVAVVQGPQN
ncbi:TPA_asm: hypothetical protein GZK45_15125 [Listeria innocua]|nr:hypothetical protein [Listeria innocua]